MTTSLALTDVQIMAAVRGFLLSILPPGTEVVKGQDNRVPPPAGTNYVVMTEMSRMRLATNVTIFDDGYPGAGTRTDIQSTRLPVQLDVHGPLAADNCQIITTLFRFDIAVDAFAAVNSAVTPLYADEARQMPFINGEAQYEDRWSVDIVLQIDPAVINAQDFFTSVTVDLIEVDATYPPGA